MNIGNIAVNTPPALFNTPHLQNSARFLDPYLVRFYQLHSLGQIEAFRTHTDTETFIDSLFILFIYFLVLVLKRRVLRQLLIVSVLFLTGNLIFLH